MPRDGLPRGDVPVVLWHCGWVHRGRSYGAAGDHRGRRRCARGGDPGIACISCARDAADPENAKNALFPPATPPKDYVGMDVATALTNVAANNLQDHPLMTVALFNTAGALVASHGAETEE